MSRDTAAAAVISQLEQVMAGLRANVEALNAILVPPDGPPPAHAKEAAP